LLIFSLACLFISHSHYISSGPTLTHLHSTSHYDMVLSSLQNASD
jgi:hypothetical protein